MSEQLSATRHPARPIVLVVDDVPENLAIIAALIRTLDIDVRVANSGPVALKYARLTPTPDLILLDIMMPDMDGHAVLAALRAAPETRAIPVIFVTALDDPADEELGLAEGAADYITKPVKPAVLKARVLAQIELKRGRDLVAGQKAWLEQEVDRRVADNARLETRLQLALRATDIGIWEYDHLTAKGEWSDSVNRLLGIDQGPTTLAELLALCHPEDRPTLESGLEASLLAGNDVALDNFRLRHRDGHWLWLEARGRAIQRDSNGKPLLTVGTLSDISRRKAVEAELRLANDAVEKVFALMAFCCEPNGITRLQRELA